MTEYFDKWLAKNAKYNSKHTIAYSNVFSFPSSLFPAFNSVSSEAVETEANRSKANNSLTQGLTCMACGLEFHEVLEQHQHFKSDFHVINLKRKLVGLCPITSQEFKDFEVGATKDTLDLDVRETEDSDDDNLSDQASSDDEASNAHNFDIEDNLIEDTSSEQKYASEKGIISKHFSSQIGASYVFSPSEMYAEDGSRTEPCEWEFMVSISLFGKDSSLSRRSWNHNISDCREDTKEESLDPWKSLNAQIETIKSNPRIAVMLMRNGRFAGAIFSGKELLVHKVLRRYTVRAKAGGGQSSHDDKNGKAQSMGAQLRRYGEQRLREDIQALIRDRWASHLQCCSLVLVAVPKTMRSILFESDHSISRSNRSTSLLDRGDERVVFIPFATGRPTLEEAKNVHECCTKIVFGKSGILKGSNRHDHDCADSKKEAPVLLPSPENESVSWKPATKVMDLQPSVDTYVPSSHSFKIFQALNSGDESGALVAISNVKDEIENSTSNSFLSSDSKVSDDRNKNNLPIPNKQIEGGQSSDVLDLSMILNSPDSLEELNTPLHIAASKDWVNVVLLLLRLGSNPEIVDIRGRTPYFRCTNKETRDAFRWFRGEPGNEERWKWSVTGVPSALNTEIEKEKRQKEKEKKKRQAQRKKENKAREQQEAIERVKLLAEQQERLEQEQLEKEKIAKTAAGRCAGCDKSLYRIDTLEVLGKFCCSSACVLKVRRRLAADAALKRFNK